MKKEWDRVKSTLEGSIKSTFGERYFLSDSDMLEGLLYCFDREEGSTYLPEWFFDEWLDEDI
jgi:hypothetical protein